MSWFAGLRDRYAVAADPLRTQRRIELLVLLLGLLLCLQLAYGGLRLVMMDAPEPVAPAADSLTVPVVLSPQTVTAEQRNEILARPLFWAGRRALDPVATREDPGEQQGGDAGISGVKLVGIFGAGDTAGIIALVKGQKRRILVGGSLDGWTLEKVAPDSGVFARAGQRETLSLQRSNEHFAAGDEAGAAAPAPESPALAKREERRTRILAAKRSRGESGKDESSGEKAPAGDPSKGDRSRKGKSAGVAGAGRSLNLGAEER